MAVYRYDHLRDVLVPVPSIFPFLLRVPGDGAAMDPARMQPEDVACCRWIGHGLIKGMTSPEKDITVFGTPPTVTSGFHSLMGRHFPDDIDHPPLCYEADHVKGFGTFVRFAYFISPAGKGNYFGVDFSLSMKPTSGVATSVGRVGEVAYAAGRHGIPSGTELVLLDCHMCEFEGIRIMREETGLVTVGDWATKAADLLKPESGHCPFCGQSVQAHFNFCIHCGKKL